MSNYKRKEVLDYLIRKPVTTQDIELARTRIQTPVTPLPMQDASNEGLETREGFKKGSDPYNLGNYIYVRKLPNGEIRYRVTFEGKEKIFKNKDEAIKHRDNLVSEKSVSVQKELGNKKFISNEDFKKLFIEKKLSDKDFANFLNEQGYVTDKKGLFTDSAVNSRRTRNDISSFVQEQRIQNVSEEGILKRAENIDAFNPNTGNVEKGELLRQYKAGVIPDLDTLLNKVQQREGTSSRTQKAKEDPEFRKIMLDRQRKSVEKMRSTPEGLERLRETQRKYRAKVALELGAPPPPKDNRERFWLDLYQTAFRAEKGGIDSKIKFADYVPEKYPSMNVVKGTTLIDSNTGEKLTFKNIENFINTYKPGKMTYDEILNEYDKKVFFQKNQDLKDFFGEKMSSNYQRGLRYNPANIHHPFGRFNNPYNIQFTFFPENKKEASLKKVFDTEFNRAETLSDKKKVFKNYINQLKGLGIQSGFNQRLYGERPTLEEQMIREGFDVSKDPRAEQIKKLKFETIEPSLAARMNNQASFGLSGMMETGEAVVEDVKGLYGKYAPKIAKGALTGLQVIGTPLASSIFYGTDVGRELKQAADEGNLTAKKALDAFVGQGEKGLYFLLPELAKDVVTSPIANKILQLGSIGRFATPVGLGLSAVGVGKDFYDQYKEFQALSPEEKEKRIKESTYTPTEQDFQMMQEAESRASAATGGRIGYADGSDDPESNLYIPPLNKSQKPSAEGIIKITEKRLGPEDPLSKYKSYSEEELAGNIEAKKPNFDILEDYILQTMPIFKPKDVAPPKSYSPMPNIYNERREKILELATGGRVGFKDGSKDPNKLIPIDPLLQDQSPTDPGRRDVLKLGIAGAGLLGLGKLGLLKLGSVAKPSIIAEVTKGTTAPSWMEGLMTKILKEGTEIKMPKESSIIKKEVQFKNPETGDVQTATLTIDPRSDRMSIEYNSSTNVADQPVVLELYRERKAVQNPDGKSFHLAPDKTKGYRFTTTESGPRVVDWDGNIEFDAEDTYYKIIDLKSDISGLKSYATEGKGINKKVAQEKRAATADIEKNPEEYVPDNYPDNKYYPND
jgi:hypothetical protein